MNDRFDKLLQYNISGIGCWGSLILIAVVGASVGFKWIISSFLIVMALFLILPIIFVWGFQWWLKRKLTQGKCPVCDYGFTGFKNTEFNCPSCGELLQAEAEGFIRVTPSGTIDIDAVEVPSQVIDEGNSR